MTRSQATGPPAPSPERGHERTEAERHRRLFMSPHDQVVTGFIARVTVMFGIVAPLERS